MSESTHVGQRVAATVQAGWLNRNVVGMGVTSLLSDAGHEMATAILPGFMTAIGLSAAALGVIEGMADAVSSLVKIAAGWISDRFGHRKSITVGGYLLTGVATALFAFACGLPMLLVARVLGWFGRGIRGPLRDSMLAESVPPEARGKAFGFHRAGDTLGAIIGPLVAVGLLAFLGPRTQESSVPFRIIFLLTLIPGVGSALAFALMVRDRHHGAESTNPWVTVRNLPAEFRRFLWGVGIFGLGDFSHTLMILAATQLLSPSRGLGKAAQIAGLLYVLHNGFYAAASYPVGALSDWFSRYKLLATGYAIGALTVLGFLAAFAWHIANPAFIAFLFVAGGVYMAVEDPLEGAITADFIRREDRGTAYGLLGTVNGVGDLVASLMVGSLWTAASPLVGFACAGVLMVAGSVIMYRMVSLVPPHA